MDKSDGIESLSDAFPLGQIVVSRRGKDRGTFYIVVGFPMEGRLALADAEKFNVSRPKKKNPRHVQATSHRVTELLAQIEAGENIDCGRLCQALIGLRNAPEKVEDRNREAG